MIYLYLFGTCFHFIYVFMIIGNNHKMRFLLLIETHVGARIKTGKDWLNTVFF